MQATTTSVSLVGLEAHLIRVEVDSGRGLPSFHLVGLPEAAVRESRVRVRAALRLLDVELNEFVITVNLAPAYLRKAGSSFDLAIALGTLGALEKVKADALKGTVLLGELSLTGELRAVRGVLPSLLGARKRGLRKAIVPRRNGPEAAAIAGIDSRVAATLVDVVAHFNGEAELVRATSAPPPDAGLLPPTVDLAEVRGQPGARRALEIAAAGEHNLLMVGPPGAGKTMLARRLPTILPPLTDEESLTVTSIHSVAGILHSEDGLVRERPFRAPHHTVSAAGLTGGGDPVRPGELSLAHHGVLFLDEMCEFRRHVLEGMRQPLEDGLVTICRARARATFPARPLLVAALNPCPCGHFGDPSRCRCSPERVRQYRDRLSGPLLDRIDLHVDLPPVGIADLQDGGDGESSTAVRARVVAARDMQRGRYLRAETSTPYNATLTQADVDRVACPDPKARKFLQQAVERLGLSARAYIKIRRLARTLADLEGREAVTGLDFVEAVEARKLDHRAAPPLSQAG